MFNPGDKVKRRNGSTIYSIIKICDRGVVVAINLLNGAIDRISKNNLVSVQDG